MTYSYSAKHQKIKQCKKEVDKMMTNQKERTNMQGESMEEKQEDAREIAELIGKLNREQRAMARYMFIGLATAAEADAKKGAAGV